MQVDNYNFSFSNDAKKEMLLHLNYLEKNEKNFTLKKLEWIPFLKKEQCPQFQKEVELIRAEVESAKKMIIVKPFKELLDTKNYFSLRIVNWLMSNCLGENLVQNENGDKSILVFDRDRKNSMAKGARYHQTREGGSIHTDNVNVPFKWHYLVLSCIKPAMSGGENILVNALHVHKVLKEKFPKVLEILEQDFIWEQRGVADALYKAPIITYNEKNEPEFRHLRPYMESAHEKANTPLTPEQIFAIDTLDSILEHSENQIRYTFSEGETIITNDAQLLHGRTSFSDEFLAVDLNQWSIESDLPLKRTMERFWVKKES